jgi:hypothetical protein
MIRQKKGTLFPFLEDEQRLPARQCCQFLANVYGQNNRKIRLLAKKFGRTHNLLLEADINNFSKDFCRTIVRKKVE